MSRTICLSFLSLLISSCAAAPASERGFAAPPDAVRAAVRRSLAGFEDVRQEEGRFTTGWGPAVLSDREQGSLLGHEYRYRASHEVSVDGSKVTVSSRAERRAPGGPRSRQWERIDAEPFREALLEAVAKDLKESK